MGGWSGWLACRRRCRQAAATAALAPLWHIAVPPLKRCSVALVPALWPSVAPAASGGDLGVALGPSPLHSGAHEVAGEEESEDDDSDAGAGDRQQAQHYRHCCSSSHVLYCYSMGARITLCAICWLPAWLQGL